MALELFVQLLEICGIKFEFLSLVLIYSYRLPTILLTFQIVIMELKHPQRER